MVILQEYLLENLQNIQTPLQINTVKPLTPAIKKKNKQRKKPKKRTTHFNGWSWFSPKNAQTDPAHRQQVGELCQIIQVLRRYGETETFQPLKKMVDFQQKKNWGFQQKNEDFPALTVIDLVKRLICRWQQTSSQFADYPLGFSAMEFNGIFQSH